MAPKCVIRLLDWAELLKNDKLNAWTSAMLRECYREVDHKDD